METSKVSVIVPCYNAEGYISRCILSILGQSYEDLEIIVIDDGSTDGSFLEASAIADPRLSVYKGPGNGGPSMARNLGISISTGDFIVFVDADDTLEPCAIKTMLKIYRRTGADMIVTDFNKIENGKVKDGQRGIEKAGYIDHKGLADCAWSYLEKPNRNTLFTYCWGRLYDAGIIKGHNLRFDARLHTFEDVAFNYEYLSHVPGIYYSKAKTYNHYVRSGSSMADAMKKPDRFFGHTVAIEKIRWYLVNQHVASPTGYALHCEVFLTIIQIIRMCRYLSLKTYKAIYDTVERKIESVMFREALLYYMPTGADSLMIPFLMRHGLVRLVLLVSWIKSRIRYGGMK